MKIKEIATKRVQRPRLEISSSSELSGSVSSYAEREVYIEGGKRQYLFITLKDAKRLHKFLGKAIQYLEGK